MDTLVIIAGPTAVGKTDLSIELAERLNGEIISADSMQVYKYMDIGTAKPDLKLQERVPHHLIDIVEPDQEFSVANYQTLFDQTVVSIHSRGRLPIMVGGTGLYIRSCTQAFQFEPGGADLELRNRLRAEAQENGSPSLHSRLRQIDPAASEKIHPNDLNRIIRALEVFYTTGTCISELQIRQTVEPRFNLIYIFLDRQRAELYRRIEERVDLMLANGLVEEVQSLLKSGFAPDLKPMQSLGYKQINSYLSGRLSLVEAIDSIKKETRNYAKRQLTWFRREPVDLWINLSDQKEFFGDILNYIEGRLAGDVE